VTNLKTIINFDRHNFVVCFLILRLFFGRRVAEKRFTNFTTAFLKKVFLILNFYCWESNASKKKGRCVKAFFSAKFLFSGCSEFLCFPGVSFFPLIDMCIFKTLTDTRRMESVYNFFFQRVNIFPRKIFKTHTHKLLTGYEDINVYSINKLLTDITFVFFVLLKIFLKFCFLLLNLLRFYIDYLILIMKKHIDSLFISCFLSLDRNLGVAIDVIFFLVFVVV